MTLRVLMRSLLNKLVIFKVVKEVRVLFTCTVHVARKAETTNAYRILVWNFEGKRQLRKLFKNRNRSDIRVGRQDVECCLRLVSGEGSFEYFTHKAKLLSTSLEPSCSLQIVN
jgi:hypothetical protein